jgi:hypothetical protein
MKTWAYILAAVAALWWFTRKKASTDQNSAVSIDSLQSSTGQGLDANQEVGLFDRLFGIRDSSRELVTLKNTLGQSYRIKICHSDGTCELQSRTVLGADGLSPIKAPKYLLDYLGVGF